MLSDRDEMRLKRAIRESPQTKHIQELQAKIISVYDEANRIAKNEATAFAAWITADQFVRELERIRDDNAPHTPNEEWNEAFCLALRLLPEAREYAGNLWYQYTEIKL